MKSLLRASWVLGIFALGLAVGGLLPTRPPAAEAAPSILTLGAASLGAEEAGGATGSTLSWEQLDTQLKVTVGGAEGAYLAVADLEDAGTWADLGTEETAILHGDEAVNLDLSGVEGLTFYRLSPVATVVGNVLRPCAEVPAECFSPRRPPPPPGPFRAHVVVTKEGH